MDNAKLTQTDYRKNLASALAKSAPAPRWDPDTPAPCGVILGDDAQVVMARAVRDWMARPEAQEILQKILTLPDGEAAAALDAILHSPEFEPVRALQGKPVMAAADDGIIDQIEEDIVAFIEQSLPQSIIITIGTDGGLGVGGGVALGYASNFEATEGALLVSGSVAFEAGEDLEVTVQVGLASRPPSELSGWSLGLAFSVSFEEGICGSLSFAINMDADQARELLEEITTGGQPVSWALMQTFMEGGLDCTNWTAFIGEADGESLEIAALLGGTYVIYTNALPPIEQPPGNCLVLINSVTCTETMDNVGKDEISIHFKIDEGDGGKGTDYAFPYESHYSITQYDGDAANIWNVGLPIRANDSITFEIHQGTHSTIATQIFVANLYYNSGPDYTTTVTLWGDDGANGKGSYDIEVQLIHGVPK